MSQSKTNPDQPDVSNSGVGQNGSASYERVVMFFGAGWFFLILFGYYIHRPIS